jgi:hypothetical protein
MTSPIELTNDEHDKLQKEYLRNELLIGGGITLAGTLLGTLYGLWKNYQYKKTNNTADPKATQNTLISAFEGALLGVLIAVIAALAYRWEAQRRRAKLLLLHKDVQSTQLQQKVGLGLEPTKGK